MTVHSISGNTHCLNPEGAWRWKLSRGRGLWWWGRGDWKKDTWEGRVRRRGGRQSRQERMGRKGCSLVLTWRQYSASLFPTIFSLHLLPAEPKQKSKDKGAYCWWWVRCWFVLCRAISLDTAAERKMDLGQPAEDINLAFASSFLPLVGHNPTQQAQNWTQRILTL